jgi:hypothetical protein
MALKRGMLQQWDLIERAKTDEDIKYYVEKEAELANQDARDAVMMFYGDKLKDYIVEE